jgi:eukaryotic-like serine/threonine-protein kinase
VAVQLQQTPFVTLLPDQRAQRTLTLMQRGADEPVRGAVAREVCQRAGAKATVEGSIAALGSSYVINLAVHNCQTGATLAQQQVQASSKEQVLAALGGAVVDIRRTLGESLASIEKYDVPVIEATTSSLEALRTYGMANRTRVTRGDAAAVPLFQKAVELDPNFALAYAKLGVVQSNTGQTEAAKKNAAKAYEFKDRVSEYERLYILWNHATRVLQDQKLALQTLEVMTTSYPRDFAARNNLGVYYLGQRDYQKAAEQFLRAVEIAPEEPLPMSNATYSLLFLDRRDEAYQWAEKSLAIRPDGGLAVTRWISAVRANDSRAEAFGQAASAIGTPQQVLAARSGIALWRGRLQEYLKLQNEQRATARATGDAVTLASLDLGEHLALASYQGPEGLQGLRQWLKQPGRSLPLQSQAVTMLAVHGDIPTAKAGLPVLEKDGKKTQAVWLPAAVARAYVQAAEGKAREGVQSLEALLVEFPQAVDLNYHLGRLRETAGDRAGAIEGYRATIAALPVLGLNPVVSGCRLALAEALIAQGDRQGANQQLDILLEQWKNADTEFALLKKVKSLRQ